MSSLISLKSGAKTKGKLERFNGYLRRSFYVPLVTRVAQGGLVLDLASAC